MKEVTYSFIEFREMLEAKEASKDFTKIERIIGKSVIFLGACFIDFTVYADTESFISAPTIISISQLIPFLRNITAMIIILKVLSELLRFIFLLKHRDKQESLTHFVNIVLKTITQIAALYLLPEVIQEATTTFLPIQFIK